MWEDKLRRKFKQLKLSVIDHLKLQGLAQIPTFQ